jgi:hypothetical protein
VDNNANHIYLPLRRIWRHNRWVRLGMILLRFLACNNIQDNSALYKSYEPWVGFRKSDLALMLRSYLRLGMAHLWVGGVTGCVPNGNTGIRGVTSESSLQVCGHSCHAQTVRFTGI